MTEKHSFDVAVIGAGPGGYAAAFKAADLGKKVALIDPEKNPGGTCLYRGCIPSKALLHLVKLKKDVESARKMGLEIGELSFNLKKMRKWKDQVVEKLTQGTGQLAKKRNIEYIRGYASFADEHTLKIKDDDAQAVSFTNAIIATGSKPVSLPGIKISSDKLMYAEQALDMKNVPEDLLVIGGGYIGLEMGTVYQQVGSKVTIAEMTASLMPGADPDLVKVYQKTNKDFFEDVLLQTKVTDIKEKKGKLTVTFANEKEGQFERSFQKVLVAVGRKPVTESLELKKAGLDADEKGFIEVNQQRKTAVEHIYAIGDVTGEPMLAHKATHEGIVAAEVIAGKPSAYQVKAIPAVVFTDPEIAWCGLTEEDAKKQNKDVIVGKFPWAASGRALSLGRQEGFTKLITEKDSGRILGAAIVGHQAGSLISEAVLAVEMAAVATDVSLSIHPHPTLSETIMEAAEQIFGQSTHFKK